MLKCLRDGSPAIPVRQRVFPTEQSNFRVLGRRARSEQRLDWLVPALGHDEGIREEAVAAIVDQHITRHVSVERDAFKAVDGFVGRLRANTTNMRPADERYDLAR